MDTKNTNRTVRSTDKQHNNYFPIYKEAIQVYFSAIQFEEGQCNALLGQTLISATLKLLKAKKLDKIL